jgi:methyl-accepting chemotaxis protein
MSSPHPENPASEAARDRARAAAKLLATEGEAAFSRLESAPFRSGDDYVFVFDWQGKLVVHAMPAYHGVDVRRERDVNGKAFGQEFIAVAQSAAGEGWVEYWWPRPRGGAPQRKRSYIVRVSGRELGVGAGVYEAV